MYISAPTGPAIGSALADPPKASTADAKVLAQAAKLAGAMHTAVQDLAAASPYLATAAQRDLLGEVVNVLSAFFPTGHGVLDAAGRMLKSAQRYRTEVLSPTSRGSQPFYFHHDTWLHISFAKANAAGMQRPFAPGHRCWIYLCALRLTGDVATLAMVLVHETIHMLGHRYRSVEDKFGAAVAGATPSKAAAALLVRSGFDARRRAMETRFTPLVEFLNRQPYRAVHGRMGQLPSTVAGIWGAHVVEELLAYVFTERATWALAQLQARRSGVGASQNLVPMQFLQDYFRNYWLTDPNDAAAIGTKAGRAILAAMETDLLALAAAVQKHVGP